MKPEKPSRNEDEYFAREDADLLRKQRERAAAASIETCPHCGGMWLGAGELEAVAKEDHPNVITRVLSDALSTFRRSPRGADRSSRGTGSPH